jgi:hypothetical protein
MKERNKRRFQASEIKFLGRRTNHKMTTLQIVKVDTMPHSKIPFQILLYHPKDDDLYEDP